MIAKLLKRSLKLVNKKLEVSKSEISEMIEKNYGEVDLIEFENLLGHEAQKRLEKSLWYH